jgi:hypothetical protein
VPIPELTTRSYFSSHGLTRGYDISLYFDHHSYFTLPLACFSGAPV